MAGFKRYKWQDTKERCLLSEYQKRYYEEFLETNRFSIPYLMSVYLTDTSLSEKECMEKFGIESPMYWRRLRILSMSFAKGMAKPIKE